MSGSETERKASRRPQSIMAQSFSTELDNLFNIDSEVDHLSQTVDQKKQMVIQQNLELQALQNRIREAEERLKARQSIRPEGGGLGDDPGNGKDSKHDYRSSGSTVSSASEATPNEQPPQADRVNERQQFGRMRS